MEKIEDVILFQIDLTSKVARQYSQKEFDKLKLGITVEQWIILKIVSESPSISQNELAEKSFRDPASITRSLDLLEKKELIIREAIENNRRTYSIRLTDNGSQFIKENMKTINAHRKRSIKGIPNEDLAFLSSLLCKIRENMQ